MECFNHLESLWEMSDSQLEALLRYDSPPETPNQLTDAGILPSSFTHVNLNKSKNYNLFNSFNDVISHNNEQFVSQMDTQNDFSIFQNDHFNTVTSLSDAVENSNISGHNVIKSCSENSFSGLDTNENATGIQYCNINNTQKYGFEDIDDISKRTDFEHVSNLEVSYLKKEDSSNWIKRKVFNKFERAL